VAWRKTGVATTTIYDNVYRPTETWQSNNTRVTTMYDRAGRTTQVKDERGKLTETKYDAVNRKTETVQPLGQRTTYTYDRASRMTLKIDALSHRTTTSYDKLDREKIRSYFDSTSSFSYDPVGNRTAMSDVSGSYTYVYDDVNQLAGTTDAHSKVLTLTYNGVGSRVSLSAPHGTTNYDLDANERVTELRNPHIQRTTLAYDSVNRITQSQLANGTHPNLDYDDADRLNQVINLKSTGTTISSYNYGLNAVGNRTSAKDSSGEIVSWTPDTVQQLVDDLFLNAATSFSAMRVVLDQLVNFTLSQWDNMALDAIGSILSGSAKLDYDAAGNRLVHTDEDTGAKTTYTYDDNNRLKTAQDATGVTTYTWDANGNQLTVEDPSHNITTNTWDGSNRLVQVENPDDTITSYVYNADGLLMQKDDGVTITRYVYDGNNLLLETDDTGSVEAEFTYLPSEYAQVISQHRSGDSSYYQFDGINNVRQMTDASQVVTDEYDFDAFGKLRSSTGSTANSQQYKGQYLAYRREPDAGPEVEYALHHRNYDPKTGTFTSADPAEDDSNLYRYVRNNPVNRDDPSGLDEVNIPWSAGSDVWYTPEGELMFFVEPDYPTLAFKLGKLSTDRQYVEMDNGVKVAISSIRKYARKHNSAGNDAGGSWKSASGESRVRNDLRALAGQEAVADSALRGAGKAVSDTLQGTIAAVSDPVGTVKAAAGFVSQPIDVVASQIIHSTSDILDEATDTREGAANLATNVAIAVATTKGVSAAGTVAKKAVGLADEVLRPPRKVSPRTSVAETGPLTNDPVTASMRVSL